MSAAAAEQPAAPRWLDTLLRAAWLGWKVEQNWADPFVFAIYTLLKPICGALTVIVMIRVVSTAPLGSDVFLFAFVGAAFQGFFLNVLGGMSMVIIEDREFYETLAYVYISPSSLFAYLLGRASIRFVLTGISVAMVLLLGTLLLGLPIGLASVDWPLLAASLVLGFACLTALGVIVAGASMMMSHRIWYLMDGIAQVLFFFSGCLFPLTVLPPGIRGVSYCFPTTYWMELVRRALAPGTARVSGLAGLSTPVVMAVLAAATVVAGLVAAHVFRRCAAHARREGYIYRKTHF